MPAKTLSSREQVYAKLAAIVVFLSIVLLNYSSTVEKNSVLETIIGLGLLVSVIYMSLYIWRQYLDS